jgi:hypothetical protein|tara:strand:- start:1828 stop:3141 length:1314 start_codon:yes stop_codon:yes gene_type:complete
MPSIDDGYGNAKTTKKKKAAKAAKAAARDDNQNNNQRANLPSEVNNVRPATPIKSTAVTTPLASASDLKKVADFGNQWRINADKAYLGNSGKGDRAVSPSITSLSTRDGGTSGSIFDMSSISGISSTPKATSTVPTTSAYVSMYENQSPTGAIDYSKSTSTDPNDGKNLSFNNQTVAAGPDKYNQEYYAKLKANGMSTANILDIQSQAIGGNPYSGATIVSEDQKRGAEDTLSRVTGSMATLQNGGVTRKYTQSGLLGEFVKGEFNWKDGTNVTTLADDPVLRGTFNESTGRIEGGIRLGSRQVTTFAGRGNYTGATAGTGASTTGPKYAVNTMSGGEDGLGGGAKTTTLTAKQSATLDDVTTGKVKLDDIVDSTTIIDAITTVEAVDGLIATTTDPDILKSLYQRRLSLMRLSRTRTRFAGLLDDPDTKKSQMSIV